MPIILLIFYMALIGLLTWAAVTYIPMPQPIKTLIVVVVIVLMLLWVVNLVGFIGPTVPRLR